MKSEDDPQQARPVEEEQVLIERDDVPVMFKRVADEPDAITRGTADVEEAVGLRGRKYYGAFDADGAEYRVCVELREGDDPEALGLEVGTLPGGRYVRVRLIGEPPEVYRLIGPTFERLSRRPDRDRSRPGIEYYRRRDVIDLLLPVSGALFPRVPGITVRSVRHRTEPAGSLHLGDRQRLVAVHDSVHCLVVTGNNDEARIVRANAPIRPSRYRESAVGLDLAALADELDLGGARRASYARSAQGRTVRRSFCESRWPSESVATK